MRSAEATYASSNKSSDLYSKVSKIEVFSLLGYMLNKSIIYKDFKTLK